MAKILIVDDSTFARARLRDLFEKSGHEVVGDAEDGVLALSLYKNLQPELVTMDHLMENKSGEDALKEIIRHDPDARIIMISGSSDHKLEERVLQAGAKAFVAKFDGHLKLLKVINQVMKS
jgi:two-component system chemotaxis response regulator CheY